MLSETSNQCRVQFSSLLAASVPLARGGGLLFFAHSTYSYCYQAVLQNRPAKPHVLSKSHTTDSPLLPRHSLVRTSHGLSVSCCSASLAEAQLPGTSQHGSVAQDGAACSTVKGDIENILVCFQVQTAPLSCFLLHAYHHYRVRVLAALKIHLRFHLGVSCRSQSNFLIRSYLVLSLVG